MRVSNQILEAVKNKIWPIQVLHALAPHDYHLYIALQNVSAWLSDLQPCKKQFVCIAMHFLVMSPVRVTSFLPIVYITLISYIVKFRSIKATACYLPVPIKQIDSYKQL